MPEGEDHWGADTERTKMLLPVQRPPRGSEREDQIEAQDGGEHGLGLRSAQQGLHRRGG